jgi:surface protein
MGNFNGHIELWDVSNVTNMKGMFWDATSFNQNISNWDVSNVTNMCRMFYIAESFNQDISEWDVHNVKYNKEIFNDCRINDEFKPKFNGE